MSIVVSDVYLRDQSPYSLYMVATDDDLRRVTIGINGGRSSLTEEVNYIPIQPKEFDKVGINPIRSSGATGCFLANSLHYDIIAEEGQLIRLCSEIIKSKQIPLTIKSFDTMG